MKTINSFRSKLFALTLAIVASVSSFAYDEMPDFQVDGLYYNFLEDENVEVTHPYIPVVPVENVASNTKKKSHAISADDYYNLTNLVIPSTVTYEGKVYNVTRIGFDAFNQCDKLTFVDIPSSVKTIGVGAFYFCSSLTSITLKEGLEHIEWNAFDDCRSLENITFPNSLKTIGNYAFSNTLWYKNHPNGAVYAGNVFYKYKGDIPQNTSFVIKEGTVSISPYAFVKENYHEDYSLVSVSIPNSVEVIGEGAFYRCRALTSIVIPDGVTTIETLAFHYCKALKSVTCEAVNPPALSGSVFLSTPIADATLYVPAESIEAYKTAAQWKEFGQILPIEQTPEDLFPTLWGLQRTHTIEMYDHAPNDGKRSGGYPLPFASVKDTVINGKTYLQFGDYVNGSVYSLFFLREENNKVLIYSSILQNDLVLYDYTLELGDSLPAITSDHDYFSDDHFTKLDKAKDIFTYVVTDVSTVTLLDGIERKKWILKNKYLPIIEYVEGIGCYGENTSHSGDFFRLIEDHPYTTEYVGDHLVCVSKNGQLLYSMTQEEMNGFTLSCECLSQEDTIAPKDLFPTLAGLQRTTCLKNINENEVGTVWGSSSYLMQEIETTTIDGKQYLLFGTNNTYDEYWSLWLREENNKILVYSAAQKKDLVLYDFTLNVGDSLPRLYVDEELSSIVDYFKYEADWEYTKPLFVTEVSTITLLDGKEYKKWTFDNGMEYVEGIGSFGTSYAWNDFYQLIANGPLYSDVFSQHLVCASKNGQLLYQMDESEMAQLETECLCDYDNGPRKDNAKNGKIGGRPTPTQWNMLEVDLREMEHGNTILRAETFSYTLENDSIVTNGKTFYQLARQSTKDTATTKSFVGALHFGEDEDNRVYFFRDGHEYVLYDFTAEPGDTLEIFAGINNYPQDSTYTHVVIGKDTIENGACRMTLEVVFPNQTSGHDLQKVWLAGLGSIDGIVHNTAKRTSDTHAAPSRSAHNSDTQTSIMLCAWRDDNCLYTTDHPDYGTYGCVYNQESTSIEDIHTSPSYQKFIRDGQLFILYNGNIYNVMGVELK